MDTPKYLLLSLASIALFSCGSQTPPATDASIASAEQTETGNAVDTNENVVNNEGAWDSDNNWSVARESEGTGSEQFTPDSTSGANSAIDSDQNWAQGGNSDENIRDTNESPGNDRSDINNFKVSNY